MTEIRNCFYITFRIIVSISGASGIYICFVVTSLCCYTLAAIFCVFILSFEKEYQYFAEVRILFVNFFLQVFPELL